MLAILERGGMLSYWGRDILLIQKAKTGFNDLSTHTSHKKKKKEWVWQRGTKKMKIISTQYFFLLLINDLKNTVVFNPVVYLLQSTMCALKRTK